MGGGGTTKPHRRDKRGFALTTLTPSQGLYFPHLEMIVPMCLVKDGLLTVAAATNLTQRTALQFPSSGTCSLCLFFIHHLLVMDRALPFPASSGTRPEGFSIEVYNCDFITTVM